MGRLGVLGVGNPLKGDDGIGVELVNRLKDGGLPEEIELHDVGTSGMNIIHYLKDLDGAIIVDALRSEGEPGDFTFFGPEEVDNSMAVRSTHDANLLEAIELSGTLGERPDEILIMGVIPEDISLGENLSPSLQEKLPELERKLREKALSLFHEEEGATPS